MNIIRKTTNAFVAWCADNSPAAKFERTVAQGLVAVGVACLTGLSGSPEWVQFAVVPTVMAVLAPIQAQIGASNE